MKARLLPRGEGMPQRALEGPLFPPSRSLELGSHSQRVRILLWGSWAPLSDLCLNLLNIELT
jgi:hypothetical protein